MVRLALAAVVLVMSATPVAAQTWPICFEDGVVLAPEGYRGLRDAHEAFNQGPPGRSSVTLYRQVINDGGDSVARQRLSAAYVEAVRAGFSPAIEILSLYESSAPNCFSIAVRRLAPDRPPALRTWHYYPVFFDSGSAVVDAKAMSALRLYAATHQPGMKVVLHGFTDTAGSRDTNMALSQRRLDAVTGAFIRLGIHFEDIETTAYGEMNLMKPSADGVSEWMNRRVSIDMRMRPR
ncbi:outer membrane protein OmpA-like peptidoglycan-associated protein [Brevundimonas vesicularis]|uniref:OmpA family protein n=1 Tax=Brevundimonas vesicularis TaxID=41276 RepID=UPI00277EEE03|nr:OmpA family protein [Brevundimonas vesicularis]MDQ1192929.1 outer membrane protein OmpA-like peptidoglycan-associated protein [Brevundimonas vesicularis]